MFFTSIASMRAYYSLHCNIPFKWTTYVVHELVKRGLEGDRLMELLSGWKKVTSPLFSSLAPDFLWFMGSGCVGFWWRGGKRTKNVGINYCDGDVGCGLWELYSGMIQGYRDQRQDEGCPEMEKWRRSCQAEMQRGFTEGWFTASEDFRATREPLEIDLGKGEGKRTKGAKCKASRSYASLRLIQIPVITL